MRSEEPSTYRFDDIVVDVDNRQIFQGDRPLDLNGRYFDALVLLIRNHGRLVEKEQFFTEVWGETLVSDSALTQCIKEIRKQLGDQASNPRYIQTVPGHGYRFVRPVVGLEDEFGHRSENRPGSNESDATSIVRRSFYRVLKIGGAGVLGGVGAGLLGGVFYGFGLAYAPGDATIGAASILLVVICLNLIIGGMGGLGVGFGLATGFVASGGRRAWTVFGAAAGGLMIGGVVHLLGLDAFRLLFGIAPEGMTGGLEGLVLGFAVGIGLMVGGGLDSRQRLRAMVVTASTTGVAGVMIALFGGELMSGSLNLLSRSFSGSHLRFDPFGQFFGETEFGVITQTTLAGVEGFLFGACLAGAILLFQSRSVPSNQ